jgi:hypothetical protein
MKIVAGGEPADAVAAPMLAKASTARRMRPRVHVGMKSSS